MNITTVLMYCSNDFRWIEKCVEQASKISNEIIIPVCDHYFDGTSENRELLNKAYEILAKYPFAHKLNWGGQFIFLPQKSLRDEWFEIIAFSSYT